MATEDPTFEQVLSLVKQLTPGQKLRLIEAIMPDLEEPLQRAAEEEKPLRSLYGLWKDFGVSIGAAEIDKARREIGTTFPSKTYDAQGVDLWKPTRFYNASAMRYYESPPAMERETCVSAAPWLAAEPDPRAISTSWWSSI